MYGTFPYISSRKVSVNKRNHLRQGRCRNFFPSMYGKLLTVYSHWCVRVKSKVRSTAQCVVPHGCSSDDQGSRARKGSAAGVGYERSERSAALLSYKNALCGQELYATLHKTHQEHTAERRQHRYRPIQIETGWLGSRVVIVLDSGAEGPG